MKTIFCVFFSLMLVVSVYAQGLFNTLTEKYAAEEGFSATNLTKDMFDLYLKKKQVEPNSPAYETLKKLDNILVVSYNALSVGKDPVKSPELISGMQKTMLDFYYVQKFTLFKTENRNGENLKVFIKKNGEKVAALSLVSATPTRITLVELNGDVDMAGISDLNKTLNMRGLENLYKINGQQDNFILGQQFFDDNRYFSLEQQQELQKNLQQSYGEIEKLNSEKMKEWSLQNREMTEKQKEMFDKQKEMAEKYRQMAEKYGRHPIFLSAPGDTNMVYFIDGKKVTAEEINKINSDKIESITIVKPDNANPSKKGEMKIKTKK
jgi:hypothetical protein